MEKQDGATYKNTQSMRDNELQLKTNQKHSSSSVKTNGVNNIVNSDINLYLQGSVCALAAHIYFFTNRNTQVLPLRDSDSVELGVCVAGAREGELPSELFLVSMVIQVCDENNMQSALRFSCLSIISFDPHSPVQRRQSR